MKRFLLITILTGVLTLGTAAAVAQPKARRQTSSTPQQGLSPRARLMYPTSPDIPDDVVWRRDLYREIRLDDAANAGLYYPIEPVDRRLNLFTYLFKLALNGYIPVYEYRLDGMESFSDSARIDLKTLLDDQQIPYGQKNGRLHVDNSDIPSADVTLFYLKECAYYDHTNAQFRRKVLALCPVMVLEDEFGGTPSRRPLFWVRYADAEPYLNRQTMAASPLNDATTMTFEDFFTLHCYQGNVYRTGQRTGQLNDEELAAFERRVFGHTPQRDSIEAARQQAPEDTVEVKEKKQKTVKSRQRTVKSKASSTVSRQPRVSVRRQRH